MKRDKKIIIGIFALISIVVIYQTAQAGLLDQLLGGQTDTPVDKIDKPINIDTNITKTPVNKDVARLSSDYLKQDFNSKYGSIAVTDSIDKVVEYTLNYNSDFCLTSCSARGKATLYKDGSLFDDVYFTNKFGQKITIPDYRVYLIDYKTVDNFIPIWTTSCMDVYNITTGKNNNVCTPYITGFNNQPSKIEIPTQYNGEVLTAGNYEWKITGKKKSYETIDWIAISNNQQLKEWGWWNASYSIKKQVNITGVGMSGLTSPNFTVFIRVPYASPMNLNYTDVTFSDTTETSELHFDRDYTNSTEMGVWVEIPNMTTGVNSIYMLYNSTVTNDRQNRPNAWDKEQAVWHFTEYPSTMNDSKGILNVTHNSFNKTSLFGYALNFSSTKANATNPNILFSTNPFTITFWMKSSYNTGMQDLILHSTADVGPAGWVVNFYQGNVRMDRSGVDMICYPACSGATSTIANGSFQHIVITRNTSKGISLFFNGALVKSATSDNFDFTEAPNHIQFGDNYLTNSKFYGELDEVRIINGIALNATQVLRDYQNSNKSTYVFGSAQFVSTFPNSVASSPSNATLSNSRLTSFVCNNSILGGTGTLSTSILQVWNSSNYKVISNPLALSGILNITQYNVSLSSSGNFTWNCFLNSTDGVNATSQNTTLQVNSCIPPSAINQDWTVYFDDKCSLTQYTNLGTGTLNITGTSGQFILNASVRFHNQYMSCLVGQCNFTRNPATIQV